MSVETHFHPTILLRCVTHLVRGEQVLYIQAGFQAGPDSHRLNNMVLCPVDQQTVGNDRMEQLSIQERCRGSDSVCLQWPLAQVLWQKWIL